jgi:uncharacterized protein (DUF1800 family)
MTRLRIAALLILGACSSAPPPESASAPELPAPEEAAVHVALPSADQIAARELNADEQVKQAIERLTWGPRPGLYDTVRAMGVDRWVYQQLEPARIHDPAADQFVAQFPLLTTSIPSLLAEIPTPGQEKKAAGAAPTAADSAAMKKEAERSRKLLTDLQAAKVGRALISERQLDEVMVDFWFNHFNVFAGKGPERYYLPAYERMAIRPYALGKFRSLLGAVAQSPAMLFYLDNWESRANANEPTLAAAPAAGGGGGRYGGRQPGAGGAYPGGTGGGQRGGMGGGQRGGGMAARPPAAARGADSTRRGPARGLNENYARELLELHSLGVDGGYTQEDVIEVARAFTGWSIDRPQKVGVFVFHPDWHDAGSKVVLGHYLPAGKGLEDGEHVLDILANDPHTATHIARQMAIRFVSDTPPPALVDAAAAKFTETGGDIRETLRVILTSPEFYSRAAYHTKVKSPLRLVASALRAVDATPDPTPRTAQIIARLGEPLYLHQAPDGYPLVGDSWINTGAILNRINFGLAVAAGHVPGAVLANWPPGETLMRESHEQQVEGVIALILQGEAGPETRGILMNGVNPMLASAPKHDSVSEALADSLAALADVDASMRGMGGQSAGDGMAAAPPGNGDDMGAPGAKGGGGGLMKTGVGRGRDPLARPVDLTGFAQIVGLALGAPEFQRY